MNRMLRHIQTGETSADSISVLTTASVEGIATPQAWRQVVQDLEDLGISADDANKHRAFVVQWFARAFEAANVADSHTVTIHLQGVEMILPDQEALRQNDCAQYPVPPSQEPQNLDREPEKPLPKFPPALSPSRPVFNVSLEHLFVRDKFAYPFGSVSVRGSC